MTYPCKSQATECTSGHGRAFIEDARESALEYVDEGGSRLVPHVQHKAEHDYRDTCEDDGDSSADLHQSESLLETHWCDGVRGCPVSVERAAGDVI